MFACLHGNGNLTALASEFSPVVEQTAADTVTLDASGLERLFGFPQDVAAAISRRAAEMGVKANIALASNPDAAICAARGFAGVSIIPYGDEAKYLGTLPLSLLGCQESLLETLERWGIRRLRDLAALPPLGIAERLGPEGLRLRELARGEAGRKLVPLDLPLHFEDEIELEYPVELLEPLAFLLARLVNGLATRLATRALATDELRLRLTLENRALDQRTLRLPVPTLDTKAFLKLLQLDLEAHPPREPIVHVWMGMNPVKPRAAQTGLFVLAAPEPVKLSLTLARIRAIVGEGRVGSPELVDTHRPGAFRMENPLAYARGSVRGTRALASEGVVVLALRIFRPPRVARVALASGQPSFLAAEGIRGKVLEYAGPWRSSGDWWTADSWSRDEWDIALSDGALYRIFCEKHGWFVEGSYD
ncbi:MAG TPA: DNA polymerase Y family protein [Candidatus Acidoferrales bacterium]|nr:DNA polymerase Y family protein [Candidatus Acidoferrales bacterium]